MSTGETSTSLGISKRGRLAVLTLSGQNGLNLLGTAFLQSLDAALADLASAQDVRAVIITGEGNFCAGADIGELKEMDTRQAEAFARLGHGICSRIEGLPQPVVAAISGYALGGGCEIVLACDIRVAGENAKIGLPELNLGIIPGFGGTQRLAGLVGAGRAKEMILSGRSVGAREAEAIGLISYIADAGELFSRSEEIAILMASKGPLAIREAKRLLNAVQHLEAGLEMEISSFSAGFSTADRREGIKAFIEKRKPDFKGS